MRSVEQQQAEQLVADLIREYRAAPVNLLDIGDDGGESTYLESLAPSYARTLSDVTGWARTAGLDRPRVLEVGAFLGLVSVGLARLGCSVHAVDIPEFASCERLAARLEADDVALSAVDLRSYRLPFEDGAFDLVVLCEVLEHLNVNPLPVLKEIHRVLRPGGMLYLGLPNIASLGNRKNLLRGRSIHNPIEHFYSQLAADDNMIVGLHWREYTAVELRELLGPLGFDVVEQRYEMLGGIGRGGGVRGRLRRALLRAVPSLQDSIVTFATRARECEQEFHFTPATAPVVPPPGESGPA